MSQTTWNTNVMDTNQSDFNPTLVKDFFFHVDERNKFVDATTETQRVQETVRHDVDAPAEIVLGFVQFVTRCAMQCSACTRCSKIVKAHEERDWTIRVERSGSAITCSGTTRLDFEAEGTTTNCNTKIKKESSKRRQHGKETLKAEYGRSSTPDADSGHLTSAATISLCEKGASNLSESRKHVSDAKRKKVKGESCPRTQNSQ